MQRILIAILAAAAASAVGPLWAQDPDGQPQGQPDGQYEQGRGVARISVLNGDVSVRRGDSGDVVAAAINAPVMADDRVLTASSSRAEVQLDHADMVRIGPNSEVRFTGLDTRGSQLQVAIGTVTFRVLRQSQMQVELDTPSVAVRPLREGIYRITVRDDGTSEITVRSGQAEIASQRGSERLNAGSTMNARGPASDPEFQVVTANPPDEWDRWNDDRDRYLTRSRSYQYVSPDVGGAEDLDQYGQWVNDPSYGYVWQPSVTPGWAPYQAGRWVWEDFYGWTWVSNDPWGWAPYHYGRWFWGAAGWCWYPGPIYAHPFWAPAYVGFFGWGGGFGAGVGFGFGNIGWVALAPFETFHPWWGRGFYGGYRNGLLVNNTTVVNNVNVTNVYRNARVNGGVTGVAAGSFGRGGQFASFNGSQIQGAAAVHGALPVAPDRSSLRMSDRSVSGSFPQVRNQNFASRMPASRVDHVSFEQQQRGMQQYSRSNFSTGNAPAAAGGGWRQVGDRPGGVAGSAPQSHGWSRFGEPIHGTTSAPQFERNNVPQPGGGPASGFAPNRGWGSGNGQAVRISPPIVSQREPNYNAAPRYNTAPNYSAPSYQAPRNYTPSYQAPRNNGSTTYHSAPSYNGGGRTGGGGGGHPGGGGGGHSGGGGHGGHR